MPKSKPMVLQLLSATLLIKRRRSFLNARWLLASIFLTTVLPLLGLCGFSLWPARAEAEQIWRPQPGTSWQWQLTVDEGERVDTSLGVDAYDIDGFDNDKAVVDDIHRKGAKAICYISVGSWEKWRPDAGRFPDRVKGKRMGWPGERWLDIRRTDILRPIMAHRMDMCRAKGFDAIEPDNIDGYTNRTGFPLSYQDQLRYNRMLANLAHRRGLAIALKNDTDQVRHLVGDFDFAVVEECFRYNECAAYSPFVNAGKAVLAAEYNTNNLRALCDSARQLRFSLIFKNLDLDAWRRVCR